MNFIEPKFNENVKNCKKKMLLIMNLLVPAIEQANNIKISKIRANFLITKSNNEMGLWLVNINSVKVKSTIEKYPIENTYIAEKQLWIKTRKSNKSHNSQLLMKGIEMLEMESRLNRLHFRKNKEYLHKLVSCNKCTQQKIITRKRLETPIYIKSKTTHGNYGGQKIFNSNNTFQRKRIYNNSNGKRLLSFNTYTMFSELKNPELFWGKKTPSSRIKRNTATRSVERRAIEIQEYDNIFCHGKAVKSRNLPRLQSSHRTMYKLGKSFANRIIRSSKSIDYAIKPFTTGKNFTRRNIRKREDYNIITKPAFSVIVKKIRKFKIRPKTNELNIRPLTSNVYTK